MSAHSGWRRWLSALVPLLIAGCVASPPPLSPVAQSPKFEADALIASDGRRLPAVQWLPANEDGSPAPVKAVIVALHGFNDRKAAFEIPATTWRRLGIATFAYDQRGFAGNPDRGEWPGEAALVRDADDAIAAARARFPGVPVVALGESMGGAVLLAGLDGHSGAPPPDPDRVVLVAPAVWGRDVMKVYARVALWVAIRLIPRETFTGRGFGVRPSDNIPMLRAFARDPLAIRDTRVVAIHGLVDLMDAALDARPAALPPTLVLYGAHDQLIPEEAIRTMLEHLAPTGAVRVAFYPDGWHMLLRDLENEAVAGDVADWIADPAAAFKTGRPLPSAPLASPARAAAAHALPVPAAEGASAGG